MRIYDVVVVGAGPGGLIAALEAAKRGVTVCIFDKKKVVGVPVKCGEYLPVKSEMQALLPNAGDTMELFDVPAEAIDNVCSKIRVYSASSRCWEFEFKANIVDRTVLEGGLAELAQSHGAHIVLGKPVHLFKRDSELIVGRAADDGVKARVIIAADGFPSTVGLEADLPFSSYTTPNNVAINYQYFMDGVAVDEEVAEMYFGVDLAPGGYGWIIPKGGTKANVGVGLRTPFMRRGHSGRQCLEYFLGSFKESRRKLMEARKLSFVADILPVDGPIQRTYNDFLMAVGDSAGMVMPTNGGGIATAMITGKLAGMIAVDHLDHGTPLSAYEEAWMKRIGKEMYDSTRLRRFADRIMGNDFLLDLALTVLGARGIKDIITCRIPRGLGPLMTLLGYGRTGSYLER